MIISASRRTDIPAFYSRWFLNRLKEGFVMVRGPMNPRLVSKIDLNPDLIDCIVFWTKNPREMMDKLDHFSAYRCYFLFTVTSYGPDLEMHLPGKDAVIDTFIELSGRLGKDRVIWRYDPVLLTDEIDGDYHYRNFAYIAGRLENHTNKCIISFLDMYKKCERNLKDFNIIALDTGDMFRLAEMLDRIAGKHHIQLVTCAEEIDLAAAGVAHGKCIDDELIGRICGYPLGVKKDKHQRKACRCVESIDIGAYNTCPHICLYCYANSDARVVRRNAALHNPESPLLIGELSGDEKIAARKVESFRKVQRNLF